MRWLLHVQPVQLATDVDLHVSIVVSSNRWADPEEAAADPLNPEWQLRKDWWESITKKTIITKFENTGVLCKIEVAYKFLDIGDLEYFPGLDLGVYNDFSLDILVAMTALAAVVRWL